MLFLRTETNEALIQMLGTALTLAVLLNSTERCTKNVKDNPSLYTPYMRAGRLVVLLCSFL